MTTSWIGNWTHSMIIYTFLFNDQSTLISSLIPNLIDKIEVYNIIIYRNIPNYNSELCVQQNLLNTPRDIANMLTCSTHKDNGKTPQMYEMTVASSTTNSLNGK